MPDSPARKLYECVAVAQAALRFGLVAAVLLIGCNPLQNAVANGDTRSLSLYHIHTQESITVTFKRNGRYDTDGLKRLNWFLRDWRKDEQRQIDPRLFDLLWEVYREVAGEQPIQVISAYRAPATNSMLRRRSNAVAQNSLHTHGQALDFAIPGVPLDRLRNAGLRLQRGGVGFYPSSGSSFVHMDVGGVRHWPRLSRQQLERIFPDGRTVHIPSDGRPLANYQLALADVQTRGGTPGRVSVLAARDAGIDAETEAAAARLPGLLARIFNPNRDAEEPASAPEPAPVRVAAASARPAPAKVTAAAAPAALVPLPQTRPAEARGTMTILAAIPAPRPAEIERARPAPVRTASRPPSPNEVINARGFWAGLPDAGPFGLMALGAGASGARLAFAASEPPTGSRPREWQRPVATAEAGRHMTQVPSAPSEPVIGHAPRPSYVIHSEEAATAIAVKAGIALALPSPSYNPWLDAVALTPSVRTHLGATQYGVRDFRSLRPLFAMPTMAIAMTFGDNQGPAAERFSGQAIVFVETVAFGTKPGTARTASLR